jgi:hypothetical protein
MMECGMLVKGYELQPLAPLTLGANDNGVIEKPLNGNALF